MSDPERIRPTPGYSCTPIQKIVPRTDYKLPSLHTRRLPPSGAITGIEAEWCPVCLGRRISERLISGKPLWHCEDCENEW